MKVKHLFYATASLMIAAACTNEEFTADNFVGNDGIGELVDLKGGIVVAKGSGSAQSRAINEEGDFWWMPSGALGTVGEIPEEIGLCWTGVNNSNPDKAPATSTGSMVYTNYKFTHSGWLYEDETTPKMNPCEPYNIENGEYNKAAQIGNDGTEAEFSSGKYSASAADETLDLATGFFTTKNSAIYSGEYIVYYPYSDEFYDSPIMASAPRSVEIDVDEANRYAAISKYGFNVGYVGEFQGGQLSGVFATNPLTGAAYIGLKNTGTAKSIKQVVLYAAGADDNFIIKQELNANAIKAANNVPNNITKSLYLGQPTETSKTIVANFVKYTSDDTGEEGGEEGEEAGVVTASTMTKNAAVKEIGAAFTYVVLPVLPASISDLQILLVDNEDKTAIIECGRQDIVALASGKYSIQKAIDLKNVEFDNDYIVTDSASLISVNESLKGLEAQTKDITVKVIGEVTLSDNIKLGYANVKKNVTFKGGKLIVPADVEMTLTDKVIIESDIDVMDKGCCGEDDGVLNLLNTTLAGTINNRGDVVVGDGTNESTVVMDDAALNSLKGEETVRGEKVNYAGTIVVNAMTSWELEGASSILNQGTFEIMGADGDTGNDGTVRLVQGSTASIDNQGSLVNAGNLNVLSTRDGLKNSTAESEFVDRVGSQLTGYGMNADNKGEFICEVDGQTRYNTALTSGIRPTTIVRFISASRANKSDTTGEPYYITPGDVKSTTTGNLVSFEVASANDDIVFAFKKTTTIKNDAVSTIKALTVTDASTTVTINKLLKVNTNAIFNAEGVTTMLNKDFEVLEALRINKGTVAVAAKVDVNNANKDVCDLILAKLAKMTFANGGKSYFDVINTQGNIEITSATGTDADLVAHELWCKSLVDKGTWGNDSYPMFRE